MKRLIGLFVTMLIFSLAAWAAQHPGGGQPGGGGYLPPPMHGPEPYHRPPHMETTQKLQRWSGHPMLRTFTKNWHGDDIVLYEDPDYLVRGL